MTLHYFAIDGNYGDGRMLLMCDTSSWTADDWERIESASDIDRADIAEEIYNEKKGN